MMTHQERLEKPKTSEQRVLKKPGLVARVSSSPVSVGDGTQKLDLI
jgi:hypothetical protein